MKPAHVQGSRRFRNHPEGKVPRGQADQTSVDEEDRAHHGGKRDDMNALDLREPVLGNSHTEAGITQPLRELEKHLDPPSDNGQ